MKRLFNSLFGRTDKVQLESKGLLVMSHMAIAAKLRIFPVKSDLITVNDCATKFAWRKSVVDNRVVYHIPHDVFDNPTSYFPAKDIILTADPQPEAPVVLDEVPVAPVEINEVTAAPLVAKVHKTINEIAKETGTTYSQAYGRVAMKFNWPRLPNTDKGDVVFELPEDWKEQFLNGVRYIEPHTRNRKSRFKRNARQAPPVVNVVVNHPGPIAPQLEQKLAVQQELPIDTGGSRSVDEEALETLVQISLGYLKLNRKILSRVKDSKRRQKLYDTLNQKAKAIAREQYEQALA